jgi:hypothetical protein
MQPGLLIPLLVGVFFSIGIPIETFTTAMKHLTDDEQRPAFKKSLKVYIPLVTVTVLYGAILFFYGGSAEERWGLAFLAFLITPFSLTSAILYGFWSSHLKPLPSQQ